MTTKEILDQQQLFSRDELENMNRKELENLMVKYSIKYHGLQIRKTKPKLIELIEKYQDQIIDLKSKLVIDNSMEQYHRGTVEYRLPTLIINRIIRDLWHDDIYFSLGKHCLRSNYRWLLSIALVSKEFFKLISLLFTRFAHVNTADFQSNNPSQHLMNSVASRFSILKNISHLTLSMSIFVEIINRTTYKSVEIGLIFNRVRTLRLKNYVMFQDDHCKSIIQHMPNLESLTLPTIPIGIDSNKNLFELLKEIPKLTSLDLSFTIFFKLDFSIEMISSSIQKLKLPIVHNFKLSDTHRITTLGLSGLDCQMINSQFKQITKLIFFNEISSEAEKILKVLLCSPDCKVNTLYVHNGKWIDEVLGQNQTITTLDITDDLETTFKASLKSTSIKLFIFLKSIFFPNDSYQQKIGQATGYVHYKSKNRNVHQQKCYAKKIYHASQNANDNKTIEATYPNIKFLYFVPKEV
ncbi:hypothetical protein PPL_01893 [Heterostelium album PN500]|uniref:Uncharacterized protein n=1 Tax=Heterostelium pallidum (strain ATCC 26659 / Pp 5 / PN500) TaxID=670386 RepID=D3B0S6_HETP5|nr:hypothetical protein PPL_01893 [Heterostelium album PN500]EFA84900.1 hypothetical protein PPL_01893 [Heterostelium album PN500]|eukprot:XP_020437010.1 hypothetical protein PPL_01893 [Heterostelium album PN500]